MAERLVQLPAPVTFILSQLGRACLYFLIAEYLRNTVNCVVERMLMAR